MGNWEWGFGVAEMGDLTLQVPGSKAPSPTLGRECGHGMAQRGLSPWN